MRTLMWFRNDLRVTDNTALLAAARDPADPVIGVYVICPAMWRDHDTAPVRVEFTLRTLRVLRTDLEKLGICLKILHADRIEAVPALVANSARSWNCAEIHLNREYEINEWRRDEATAARGAELGLRVMMHHDQTVIEPGTLRTKTGGGVYTVFTPFKKAWLALCGERFGSAGVAVGGKPRKRERAMESDDVPEGIDGFVSGVDPAIWPGGEHEAERGLERFVAERGREYKAKRDLMGEDATSRLSAYLSIGAVSARRCVRAAQEANGGRLEGGNEGLACWISELVWREFYRSIVRVFPRVCMGRAFKAETERVPWRQDENEFAAWCEGRTGYPIVDAGMRQLRAEGWMHNRARMVTAMFLTKDLLIDWRLGERHFMRELIDGDLAQNNGGWQWSASTGTDAAPYFRIFNPVSQSKKFDPQGAYIRRWVPELRGVVGDAVHEPWTIPGLARAVLEYPERIVEHSAGRARTLRAFGAQGGVNDSE